MANILLVGLPSETVTDFTEKLQLLPHRLEVIPFPARGLDASQFDLIIASSDDCRCKSLLRAVRRQRPELPFVMVSSVADDSKWVEALEAGATDYCPADIDRQHLYWMIENALPMRAAMVSAA
jgi:DNA-binding NtrC family response regulator